MPESRSRLERRFLIQISLFTLAAVALPFLFGLVVAPVGTHFIGFSFNTDDQMVYAAWATQAKAGHFFLGNLFTTDAQPFLTVHLYFWLIGLVSHFWSVPLTMNVARILLSGVFVFLTSEFVKRVSPDLMTQKLATILALFGGGIGFLVWQNFGVDIAQPTGKWAAPLTMGKLPVDVWQTEGFIFPSLLTNSLFAVSLCLIVLTFLAVLNAKRNPVPWTWLGFISFGLLMNIHSYDALLITLVLVGFLAASAVSKTFTVKWLGQCLVIGSGAILPAIWFWHVVKVDPVFFQRAITPTYSSNFRSLVAGYLVLLLGGLVFLFKYALQDPKTKVRKLTGAGLAVGLILVLLGASTASPGYFLSLPLWIAVYGVAVSSAALLAGDDESQNLIICWAIIGLIALYFPALFQRKLTMALAFPWAILCAKGTLGFFKNIHRTSRNFGLAFAIILACGTSVEWFVREFVLITSNVSETTVQPVFLQRDLSTILTQLNQPDNYREVVVAFPGIPSPVVASDGTVVPAEYSTPLVPDMNPILSGLDGLTTYAGHWSETPDYLQRRKEVQRIVFGQQTMLEDRIAFLKSIHARFVVAPIPSAFPKELNIADLSGLGQPVYQGAAYELFDLRNSNL